MKKIYFLILFIPFLINAQVPCYVPTNGLLAWYSFNGNANDLSGNAHNGTVIAASLTTDRFNNASSAYSVGASSYIAVADNSVNLRPANITVAGWAFFTVNPTGYNILVGKGIGTGAPESVGLYFTSNNWMGNVCNNANCSSTVNAPNTPTLGTWYHVVYEFDDILNIQKIFFNGVLTATSSVSHTMFYDATPWTFGCEYEFGSPGFFLKGKVDDIGIWDRMLTQVEVTDLYNALTTSVTGQPVSQTVTVGSSTAIAVASSTPSSYQWQADTGLGFQNLANAGQYSGVNTATLTVSNISMSNNNEQYRCIVSISPSCSVTSNTATLTVLNSTGINSIHRNNFFNVYPNPVTNSLYITTADISLINREYKIINVVGVVIKSGVLVSEETVILTEELADGVYFINIGESLKKVVKIK